MPVQLNWLGAIVSLKAPDINVQMLNAYQARPDYEAITLLPDAGQALCTGGRIAGQPGARWKPLAPPQLAMDFDFRAGMGKSSRDCSDTDIYGASAGGFNQETPVLNNTDDELKTAGAGECQTLEGGEYR